MADSGDKYALNGSCCPQGRIRPPPQTIGVRKKPELERAKVFYFCFVLETSRGSKENLGGVNIPRGSGKEKMSTVMIRALARHLKTTKGLIPN